MSKHVEERRMHEMKNRILSLAMPLLLALSPAAAQAARILWVNVGGSATIVDAGGTEASVSQFLSSDGMPVNAFRVSVSDETAPEGAVSLVFAYEDESGAMVLGDESFDVHPLDFGAVSVPGAAWAPVDLADFTGRSLIVTLELGYADWNAFDNVYDANDSSTWYVSFEPLAVASETLGNLLDAPHVSIQSDLNPPALLPWSPDLFTTGWTIPAIQRATGACEPIFVTPADLASIGLAGLSGTTAVSNALNEVQSNGCRAWENLVLGNLATNLFVADVSVVTAGGLQLDLPATAPADGFGYDVLYDLRRTGSGGGSLDSSTDPTALEIPLYPDDRDDDRDPSGLYRIVTLLVPESNLSVTNEIVSTNAIGVLKVTSGLTNSVTAVPWKALASDPLLATNVAVSQIVHPANLAVGDRLLFWDAASGEYRGWTLSGSGASVAWESLLTATMDGVTVAPAAADWRPAPGTAFWIVRSAPCDAGETPAPRPFFLYGQWSPGDYAATVSGGSDAAPVSTLCANPTARTVSLSELSFDGDVGANDTLVFTSSGDVSTIVVRNSDNTAWGRWSKTRVGARIRNTWVQDVSVAPGTGFWYVRRTSGDLTVQWPGWEE